MPIIEVPGHGQVEFPDGMSDAEITAAIKRNPASMMPKPTAQATRQPAPNNEPSSFIQGLGNLGYGMLKGAADLPQGAAQLIAHGAAALSGNGPAGQYVKDKSKAFDDYLSKQEAQYQSETPGSIAAGVGRALNPTSMLAASKLPVAASLGGRVLAGATSGAGMGALTPVTGGSSFQEEKLQQVLGGAIAGGAFPVLTGGLARAISPNASLNRQLRLLKDEGVNPTIGQALGGQWANTEAKLQTAPILGDAISVAKKRANADFDVATFNRALTPIGETLPTGKKGGDAVAYTGNKLSERYNDVLNKIGSISTDNEFGSNIYAIKTAIEKSMMPAAEKEKFVYAFNNITQSVDNNGVMTADAYKALESSLKTMADTLKTSKNIYENQMGVKVLDLRSELKDLLSRQAGPNAKELNAVNEGWANFKRVEKAAGYIGAENQESSPAQYLSAVRALDRSKDNSAFASSTALGQDLGNAGKTILGSKIPNSFTADRAALNGLAGGLAVANPAALMAVSGLLGGAGLYTPQAQKALVAMVSNRGANAPTIANSIRRFSPLLTPVAGQAGIDLLSR